jgi:hypothetical protein
MKTPFELPEHRCLLVIDHDDDVQEILSVICDGCPSPLTTCRNALEWSAS